MLPAALIAAALFAHAAPARPPLPDPMPQVHYADCPGGDAFTIDCEYPAWSGGPAAVYVQVSAGSYVFHHELGHAYLQQLPATALARLAPVLGRRVYGAWGGVVDERAAELYAACRMRVRPAFGDDYRLPRGAWVYGCDVLTGVYDQVQ